MRCSISYHLYILKNVKNTHGGVLILVKLLILVLVKLLILLKLTLLHGCFSRFSYCTNGTKSRNASHITILASNCRKNNPDRKKNWF